MLWLKSLYSPWFKHQHNICKNVPLDQDQSPLLRASRLPVQPVCTHIPPDPRPIMAQPRSPADLLTCPLHLAFLLEALCSCLVPLAWNWGWNLFFLESLFTLVTRETALSVALLCTETCRLDMSVFASCILKLWCLLHTHLGLLYLLDGVILLPLYNVLLCP